MAKLRSVGNGDDPGDPGDGGTEHKRKRGRPSGDEFDPWNVESKVEYQDDRLYTRSTNKFDHSVRSDVRTPPAIHAIISQIVEQVPGYRSIADFYRDATIHRMKWWMDRDMALTPEMETQKNMELWLAELNQLKLMMDLTDSIMSEHRELLDRAEKTKDQWVLGKTIQGIEERAEMMGEPFTEQLRGIASEYRKRLKGMGSED